LQRIDPEQIRLFENLRNIDSTEREWRDYALTVKDDPEAAMTTIRNLIATMEPDEGGRDLEAITGISKLGQVVPETIPEVVLALLDQPHKREKLSWALGLIGRERPEVVDQAMALLDHQDSDVQKHAVEILGTACALSTWTIPDLLEKVSDETDSDVADAIQMSLVSIASDSNEAVDFLLDTMLAGASETIALDFVLGEAADDSDYALEQLSTLLTSSSPKVREKAANALHYVSRADTSKWIENYCIAFCDENPTVRRGAVVALCGAIGTCWQELIPLFREALFDDDDTIRIRAARALEAMGPRAKEAASDLARLCEDSDKLVRCVAKDALDAVVT
jgi:HEAT repeat protein